MYLFSLSRSIFYSLTFTIGILFVGQNTTAQTLSVNDKSVLKKQLSVMESRDQKYRSMIDGLNQTELDSLEKVLPKEDLIALVRKKLELKKQIPSHKMDSLMNLQTSLDSINEIEFTQIVNKYGYPSFERTGSYFSMAFSLHLMGENNFKKWKPILISELKKGNIGGPEYARWYDRSMLMQGKKQLYGEYNSVVPCVEDLSASNNERKKLGLQPLQNNNCSYNSSNTNVIEIKSK